MSIIEVNWNPNRRHLRLFGIVALVATLTLSVLLHFMKGLPLKWACVIVAFGAVICVSSLILPEFARIIYVVLVGITLPVGMAVSFVLMSVFYYLILTPTGLLFRLMGRDVLDLKYKRTADSYWVKRKAPDSLKRYFHQF